jgi:hypothetical protein
MTKSENADFQEIFGSSSVSQSLNADAPVNPPSEPALPLDDTLWEFLAAPLGKAGQQIADQALIAEISGYEPAARVSEPTPAPPSDALISFTAGTPTPHPGAR